MSNTVIVESSGHECDVSTSTWLKDILPRTPGIVRKVATRELVLAAREFFEQSHAWRATLQLDARAGKKRYRLSPYDAYSDVTAVLGVSYNEIPLRKLSGEPIAIRDGQPIAYWLEGADTVRFQSTPNATVEDAFKFYFALAPKQTVSKLPRMALTHFYDALLDGVLGRLYAHPAKPYSNPTLGQYHLKRFRNAIGQYGGRAKQGYSPGAQAWVFPRFGK